jgi:hypothetical protein
MGNPAEGNDRTPNRNHSYEIQGSYVKDCATPAFTDGLYLWHIPVFRTIHARLWPKAYEIAAELVLSSAITLFSFYVIERPALRVKQMLREKKLGAKC